MLSSNSEIQLLSGSFKKNRCEVYRFFEGVDVKAYGQNMIGYTPVHL